MRDEDNRHAAAIRLADALQAWGTPAFASALAAELGRLEAARLPLGAGSGLGGRIEPGSVAVTVLGAADSPGQIHARVGVFFVEVVGGCSCGDEPVAHNAWCELRVRIDKASGAARLEALHD